MHGGKEQNALLRKREYRYIKNEKNEITKELNKSLDFFLITSRNEKKRENKTQ